MAVRLPILVALLVLAACDDAPPPPPPPPAAPVAAKTEASGAEKPVESLSSTIEYSYSPVGKRDPFRSPTEKLVDNDSTSEGTDCGPLCRWEIDQLKLVAVVSGVSNPMAMVEDPAGRGHILRRGTNVGKRGGTVSQILAGEVEVTEFFKNQSTGVITANPVRISFIGDKKAGELEDLNFLAPEVRE